MHPRRAFLMCSILAGRASVSAQGTTAATEESLRDAIRQYVEAWNRHDVDAWSGILTDDIWYTEAIDFYERMKGRPAVIGFFGDMVKTTDIKWEIVRVKMMPNGTASVVLRHVSLIPPKTDGKYKSEFESVPSLSRWRHEGGRWKMFYFTSHKRAALDGMTKDGVAS